MAVINNRSGKYEPKNRALVLATDDKMLSDSKCWNGGKKWVNGVSLS